jgi:hypothetical protein
MANSAPSTDCARWTSALANYSLADLAWSTVADAGPCDALEDIQRAVTRARHNLLTVPAPTIVEVIDKLEIHWGDTLFAEDWSSTIHRTMIGDLRRLALLAAGANVTEASGQTPAQMTELGDAWRAMLAEYDEHEQLLAEGPSDRWTGRKANDIVDVMDHAACELLELPAPSLRGVIRKLELLWGIERFETIEEGGTFVQIVGDLNRLCHTHEAELGRQG